MTTSGTYSFTVNRDQIIRQAMLNIGKLDEIETPTAQEVTDCNFMLNMMIKQWQGNTDFSAGLKVWHQQIGYMFLHAFTGVYQVGPTATGWTNAFTKTTTTANAVQGAAAIQVASTTGIAAGYKIGVQLSTGDVQWLTVLSLVGLTVNLVGTLSAAVSANAWVYAFQTTAQQPLVITSVNLRDSQNNDVPLKILTVEDYDNLPAKAQATNQSDPSAIYYEFQLGNSNLYTDVAGSSDTSKYLVIRYLRSVKDIVNPNDSFDYPQEWFLALAWGLASEISPMFKAMWTPKMEANFQRALQMAQSKAPDIKTIFFQPGAME